MPSFRTHAGNWDDFNDAFDGPITSAEMGIVPVTLLLAGAARHDSYATKTGLLAGEADGDGAVGGFAPEGITPRARPKDVAAGVPVNRTLFCTPQHELLGASSSG